MADTALAAFRELMAGIQRAQEERERPRIRWRTVDCEYCGQVTRFVDRDAEDREETFAELMQAHGEIRRLNALLLRERALSAWYSEEAAWALRELQALAGKFAA